MRKVIGTCIVRQKLGRERNKTKFYKLRKELQKEYCGFDSCFLCPYLEMKRKK